MTAGPPRASRATGWAVLALALAGCSADPPPPRNVSEEIRRLDPSSLAGVAFRQGRNGPPDVIGCADGQREGFVEDERFVTVAGCLGSWEGRRSLRARPTGEACGDDLGPCAVPADLCAEGWHVCGRDGDPQDLSRRISAQQCREEAGPGKFVAGLSHGHSRHRCGRPSGSEVGFPCYTRGDMAEPVCCGADCTPGSCADAVWPGETPISRGPNEGCEQLTSARNGGVLCCRDAE